MAVVDLNDPYLIRTLGPAEMDVHFQPIVDLQTRSVFAVEGLARCTRHALSDPLRLFHVAAKQEACGRLGRLIRDVMFPRCEGYRVFANVHPQELSSRWLVRPDDPINYHHQDVYLEITETAAFEYYDLCRSVLSEVCARANAHLVLDDLGAGHSNLSRLLELNPAVVKLDRALISGMDQSKRKRVIVRHLASLCAELSVAVVAEGVETSDELSALTDIGIRYAQGFYFARPANPIPTVRWPTGLL